MALWVHLHCPQAGPGELHALAMQLLHYTPNILPPESQGVSLEIQESLHLFKGPLALLHHLRQQLRTLQGEFPGLTGGRTGMAPTCSAARVLSQLAAGQARHTIGQARLARLLAPLPVHVLPEAMPYLDWLESIHCATIGQLYALPCANLQQRTSPGLVRALQALHGTTGEQPAATRATSSHAWFRPAPAWQQAYTPETHLESTPALQHAVTPLLHQACQWLAAQQMAAHGFVLLLHHSARHGLPPTRVTVQCRQATRQPQHLLSLLQAQLASLQLQAPVAGIEIQLLHIQVAQAESHSLFPSAAQGSEQAAQVFDLICARLGHQAVRRPAPLASYLPEQANQWLPGHPAIPLPPGGLRTDLSAHSRPCWLLQPPLALEWQANGLYYQGRALHLRRGPERLETGWWQTEGHQQRDYFIAEDDTGTRYWVYHLRHGAQNSHTTPAQWFLHGLFG